MATDLHGRHRSFSFASWFSPNASRVWQVEKAGFAEPGFSSVLGTSGPPNAMFCSVLETSASNRSSTRA
eukprot:6419026-Amphidinium_carterae.1